MLADDTTTFHGEFYNFTDAPADPKPVQSPLPLLVGTRGPRMLRITARHANEWNTWHLPDLADRVQALTEACEKTGRDPATMWRSVNALIDLGGSTPPSGRTMDGSAQQLIDQLGQYSDLGFDEFIAARQQPRRRRGRACGPAGPDQGRGVRPAVSLS